MVLVVVVGGDVGVTWLSLENPLPLMHDENSTWCMGEQDLLLLAKACEKYQSSHLSCLL